MVDALNGAFDSIPPDLQPGQWWGNVHRIDTKKDAAKGLELQNVVEAGEPFERLVDHSSTSVSRRFAARAATCRCIPAATARRCAASTGTSMAFSAVRR